MVTYSVNLKTILKPASYEDAKKAVLELMKDCHFEVDNNMSLSELLCIGLCNDKCTHTEKGNGIDCYDSGFDGNYSHEIFLFNLFVQLKDYLDDGSYIRIYPDNHFEMMMMEDGELIDSGIDEDVNPVFDNAEELLDRIEDTQGFYNKKSGMYLYYDSDTERLFTCRMSTEKFSSICKKIRVAKDINYTWKDYLDIDLEVIPPENVMQAALDIMDEHERNNYLEEWVPVTDCTDILIQFDEAEAW